MNASLQSSPSSRKPGRAICTLAAGAVLALQLLGACSSQGDGESAASPTGLSPQTDLGVGECLLSEAACEIIGEGIEHLMNHSSSICRNLGDAAYGRFHGDLGNYRWDIGSANWMGVNMANTGGWSGWQPTDGDVRVYNTFAQGAPNLPTPSISGLLAHEELHHLGYKHGLNIEGPLGINLSHSIVIWSVQQNFGEL